MVQNKIGRPRKFDPEAILAAAMEVFWLKGYSGASLDDLTRAMGINRPTLYSTFGEKQGLYLATLRFYGEKIGLAPLVAFEAANDPEDAVRAFFETLLRYQTRPGNVAQGCLLASCAATTAGQVPGVAALLLEGTTATTNLLEEGFEKFKRANQLAASFPSRMKARLMLDMMHGFAFRSRIEDQNLDLLAEIDDKIAQVISVSA